MEFGEIAKALVDSSFPEGYDVISERKWIEDIERVNEVATRIVLEPLQCAEELFYHGDRENTREEFPFGDGCRSDPSSCNAASASAGLLSASLSTSAACSLNMVSRSTAPMDLRLANQ